MNGNDFLLNGGFALGGGLGSMPVVAPYSIGGVALSPEMQQQMMPMGMMNRSGQEMMGQQQPMTQPQGMSEMDRYRIMAQGIQGMGRGMQQQMPSGNTAQIIRDSNQFRFAGTPQQQMAQALRNRG